ncbi:forkhead box protein P3 isoform X1 [Pimephales promelas]|uniref:forkhead box protein P3 isoform X1 n=2 Tax=Pimephales promelas TaxID=90988 RepID=UPI0019559B3B|nr:forkhead box protein P3 isoform X1 [Pimephales promelas]
MWEGGNFRLSILCYKDPFTLVFNQNSTGRQRLTTKAQGMPRSERESEKSGRENERQPQLKEEHDASPPLKNERSSHQCVEDLSSAVCSNSASQTVGSVQLSHTVPSNNSTYLKHPLCQRTGDEERMDFLQLVFQNSRAGQIRPSVLRSTALLLQANDSHPAAMNRRKETAQISIHAVSDRKQSSSLHHHSPVQTEIQRSSSLYINGQCRWPGCDKVFEGYTHFLRHLNRDHSTDEKTIAQWRVQQDLVRHMENQLIQEKQKLHAMQIHLQLFDCISACTGVATGRWRPLALKLPPLGEPDGRTERAREAPVQQDPWHIPPTHMLPDFVSSVEYYKYANIRPPYTYAFLIRWSIVEAPEKQRTLNEIYNWFTRMFYYFRHSSPTWKNAVRHNLSLHKCFVRVDGRMGAVWTVDEEEFQKRKGQKINRDYTLNWLTPSNCRSHEASDV